MSWNWRLENADAEVVREPVSPVHQSQSDAENWLGEHWRELAAAGVARTTLLHDGETVYGPMPLSEG